MKKVITRTNLMACVALLLLQATSALAADGTSTLPPSASQSSTGSPSPASPAAQEEARTRFNRALELYDDGDFDAARLELARAYELAPSYRILYNIGLVSQQLKQYAHAYDAYERYLSEGGPEVPADRVADVRHRLDHLKDRIAYLSVTSDPPGADVFVDDAKVGQTPFNSPMRVDSGRRRVSARLPNRGSETQIVELAGGEQRSLNLNLNLSSASAAPKNLAPWIGWGVTAAITAGAVTSGVLALSATKNYDNTVNTVGITGSEVNSAWSRAHAFALTTDILGGTAIVAAAVSIYLTVRSPKDHSSKETSFYIFPGGASGTF